MNTSKNPKVKNIVIMKEKVWFEKVIPNISGVPLKINEGQSEFYVEKGKQLCGSHLHGEIELLYIFSGYFGTRLADGSEYIASPGDVVCINSNVVHSTFAADAGDMSYGLIQFKSDSFIKKRHSYDTYLSIIRGTMGKPIEIFHDCEINSYCRFLHDKVKESEPSRMLYLTSGIYGIMASLYKCGFFSDESDEIDRKKIKKLIPALEYISESYKENLSLNDVCERSGMSSYYFCRLFKNTLKIGFTDYLNAVRIYHASEMLTESDKSVLEVSLESGFSSVSYFNRVFKSIKNCSPSEYRSFSKEAFKIQKSTSEN